MASDVPVPVPGPVTDYGLWAQVIRYARCADSGLDPDGWFPVSIEPSAARHEAAAAIAVCATCLVRAQCLALSLRHWDVGQHGIWGGLVSAARDWGPHCGTRRYRPAWHDHPLRRLYPGHLRRAPLYTYVGDTRPGQANGNNLNLNGGLWHEVTVSGARHP